MKKDAARRGAGRCRYAEATVADAHTSDTIAAIATPAGRGGIGVLRLSGAESLRIAGLLLRVAGPLEANRARWAEVMDPATGEKLDEAVATYFAGPRSYTGEDVVEIAAHGSPVLLDLLLGRMMELGARLAEPGEFTQRAFLAGRIDLTQAEAVRDLIEAHTVYQARVAARQMDGALSRRVAPSKLALIRLIAQLEAGIDFAEDDTPTLGAAAILDEAEPIAAELTRVARSFQHGRLVHAGVTMAIVGEPNVGKSSLFNCLVERERAIVTAAPGTTRDLVTERISVAGIPVELVDTAGLREGAGLEEAERLGMAKSREAVAEADLVLLVLDGSAVLRGGEGMRLLPGLAAGRGMVVLNKCDLLGGDGARAVAVAQALDGCAEMPVVLTSARTGEGVPELREAIRGRLQAPAGSEETGLVTNLRQHRSVEAARAAVEAGMEAARREVPHEMVLLDFYGALQHLDALTGQTTSDDVLHLIFSTFCIGK
ncbi:MAG TPA: tRNA uridine-5-carboxymethylaminomethyl(34) synthesis GTPase MnmE [Acidobacteriaceae bacterium]